MRLKTNKKNYYAYLPVLLYQKLKEIIANQDELKIDGAVYIIDLILNQKFKDKNLKFGAEKVSLSSVLMQKHLRNYNKYLEFLKEFDIIDYNTGYCEFKSRQYWIKEDHFDVTSKIITHKMQPDFGGETIRKFNKAKMLNAEYRNPELTKWLSGDLNLFTIEYDKAVNYVNDTYKITTKDRNMNLKRMRDIERFQNKDFNYSREGKDDRFHSIFTSLASDLKQFIRYDGIRLAEIDIKSAQPVMISVVFDKIVKGISKCFSKYSEDSNISILRREVKKEVGNTIKRLTNTSISSNKNNINYKKYILGITIMLVNYLVTLDKPMFNTFKSEINDFVELVREGSFYEVFGKQLLDKKITNEVVDIDTGEVVYITELLIKNGSSNYVGLKSKSTLREVAKAVVLNIIYKPVHDTRIDAVNFFREQYPAVSSMLNIFMLNTKNYKDKDHKKFPVLIQNIESKAMLDYCVKKVAKKHPKIPLVTIHDSVSTTIEYHELLGSEFLQHLKNYFDFDVKCGEKEWGLKFSLVA